jgi:hypothetical protein
LPVLAKYPNTAIEAIDHAGCPEDKYWFLSFRPHLHRCFDAFGFGHRVGLSLLGQADAQHEAVAHRRTDRLATALTLREHYDHLKLL